MGESTYSILEGPLSDRARALWESATGIWLSGGWAMIVIAVIGFFIFALGVSVYLRVRSIGYATIPEATWRRWILHPEERRGRIGHILDSVTGFPTLRDMSNAFDQVRESEVEPLARDLRVMKVFVSAAPLVGLLGTVMGMLATFDALANGTGGDKTMSQIAKGISEALITTETGLVIALPGLFLQYQMGRKVEKYDAFLAHMETVCSQSRYREDRDNKIEKAREVARKKVAKALYDRMSRQALQPAFPAEES